MLSRIMIVGTSGAGKTTLARTLSKRLSLHDIELDALFWNPHWQESSLEDFRKKITSEIEAHERFVIHGNYSKVRDLTWSKCDTLIWLDYSKPVVMWRVIKRSILRIITREKLWSDNRESFYKTFFSKDSIIRWSWTTFDSRKKQNAEWLAAPENAHLKVLHFTSPQQTSQWLDTLSSETSLN